MAASEPHREPLPSSSEQIDRPLDARNQPRAFRVGDRLPVALSKQELADVLGVTVRSLDAFRTSRSHPAIKELPGPGHPRFSGATAQAWLDQQAEAPKFFRSARKR